ncbi:hypothetical protein EHQ76_07250 [Leptospira barantonii]|uniref:Uncharacterized protein n=1 Tax=Leptospira barantonii TaxID=2023184 RepID=A0A5F2BH19_9LEPT|nr:hypothetical protein [Leptospira barantonii]TGM04833.1 hypothetical protein EHQ76_07250 [Leptospira barantonii]
MHRESPLSEYRAVRELTYAWLYYFLSLQYAFLGDPQNGIHFRIEKGLWSDVFGALRRKFFGELIVRPRYMPRTIDVTPSPGQDYSHLRKNASVLEFPEGVVRREDLESVEQEIFDFLAQDWNRIYLQERDKASIIGYVAQYLLGHGVQDNELKEMSLPEISEAATAHNLPGLEDLELLQEEIGLTKEQTYSLLYAQGRGAEWLAIYDKKGERKGKAYDLITKMYRRQIAEALARNATEEEIRSLMISPDDDEIKEALGLFEEGISDSLRKRREKRYEKLCTEHLNRDMTRFAYTEVQINFNNGKLLYLANERPTATYVRFAGGTY